MDGGILGIIGAVLSLAVGILGWKTRKAKQRQAQANEAVTELDEAHDTDDRTTARRQRLTAWQRINRL